jgi:prolipoprotein diacylglyceryltransferase
VVVATALLYLLMAAAHMPVIGTVVVISSTLAICLPSSKLIARIVEHKKHTSTIGGASCIGLLLAPWIIQAAQGVCRSLDAGQVPVMVVLAAVTSCYTLGEGLGRLACISFGCCYGKPLSQVCPWLKRLFANYSFVFTGATKKIAYASGLDGQQVVPIQALTTVVYVSASLTATLLFLQSKYVAAFLVATLVTQSWRPLSELLRADYRGDGTMSAYQVMGLAMVPYALVLAMVFSAPSAAPPGPQALWNPLLVVALEFLWGGIFVYFGWSTVTESTLLFHVRSEEI